jgi:hypothetical protein
MATPFIDDMDPTQWAWLEKKNILDRDVCLLDQTSICASFFWTCDMPARPDELPCSAT